MVTFAHRDRIARYQATLTAKGVSAAIVLRQPNVRYLTGYYGYASRAEYSEPRRLICLVMPAKGAPLLVTPKIESIYAQRAVQPLGIAVKRHVEWTEAGETEDSWGLVRDHLRAEGIGQGAILEVERQSMTQRAFEFMAASLGDYELRASTLALEGMRLIKDGQEIDLLRRSGDLASRMYEKQVELLRRKSCREYELALAGLEFVCGECGAEMAHDELNSPLGDGVQLITSGHRLAMTHGSASAKPIAEDDVVMLDYCRVPFLYGYRMGMGRVVSRRPLVAEERDIEASIQRAYTAGLALMRPGVTCSEIEATTRGVMVDAGLGPWIMHRNGRGVGIENVELPEIKEGVAMKLEAGMVVSLEPSIYREGFAARVENTLLITEGEPELLTRAPAELRILT